MQAELRDLERAAATGTKEAGRGLKTELRRQVTSAGLGQRLARTWRDKHFDNRGLDAASLVYTKAPQIIRAFDEGAVIRSKRGRFLAIPTENAPRKGTDGKRISPRAFPEHRFGPLRFVYRRNGPKRCSGKLLGLIRLPPTPRFGALGVGIASQSPALLRITTPSSKARMICGALV